MRSDVISWVASSMKPTVRESAKQNPRRRKIHELWQNQGGRGPSPRRQKNCPTLSQHYPSIIPARPSSPHRGRRSTESRGQAKAHLPCTEKLRVLPWRENAKPWEPVDCRLSSESAPRLHCAKSGERCVSKAGRQGFQCLATRGTKTMEIHGHVFAHSICYAYLTW